MMKPTILFSIPFFFMSCEENIKDPVPNLDQKVFSKKQHEVNDKIALEFSTYETEKVPRKKSPAIVAHIRKSIAPELMLEHAKKIDPKGLGRKGLEYFKNIKEEDFGLLVTKSRVKWKEMLSKYGIDPETGKAKFDGVLAVGWAGLILDTIKYIQAPTAEEKKELIDMANAHMKLEVIDGEIKMIDGEIKVKNAQMSDDQRTRLNALLGQSPIAPQ